MPTQLVELKNGETYNGHLVNCDNWMNIQLKEVICTSRVSEDGPLIACFYSTAILSEGMFTGALLARISGVPPD